MNLGLYIHVPFCHDRKCDYCDFFSVPVNENDAIVDSYIRKLTSEIGQYLKNLQDYSVDTIYFGGGTPSILSSKQVASLLKVIYDSISVSSNVEISLECNPEDLFREKAISLVETGINRLTLGVQTLDISSHNLIGRSSQLCSVETLETFFKVPDIVHAVDVISGIPGLADDVYLDGLGLLVSYRPEHFSIYSLTVEKHTRLFDRLAISSQLEQHQRTHVEKTISFLKNCGYDHYEISNYCLPGFESKHNLKYWKFDPYIGFGPGAHSFLNNIRFANNMNIADYIAADDDICYTIDERTENDLIVEYVMTGLRLLHGVSLTDMVSKLGVSFPEKIYKRVEKLSDCKLLDLEKKNNNVYLKLSESGFYFLDAIIFEIVQDYL